MWSGETREARQIGGVPYIGKKTIGAALDLGLIERVGNLVANDCWGASIYRLSMPAEDFGDLWIE